jgi:2-hydroxy-3-oxopropionate reductase
VRVIDAPVSGGEAKALDGTLSIMVGGPDADVAAAWGVLSACGSPTHLGPLGAGAVAKACNQLIVGAEVAALAEASLLARDAGIDLATLFDVLDRGLASSRVLEQKRDKLTTGDYTVSGPAKFMAKDLRFALEAPHASQTPLPLTTFLRGQYEGLNAAGLGDLDIAVMQRYIDEQSVTGRTTTMQNRYACAPEHVKTMDTSELRERFLIEDLFQPGEVSLGLQPPGS